MAGVVACVLAIAVLSPAPASARTKTSRADIVVFQAAGDVGGGVLTAGDTFAPTTRGFANLRRHTDAIQVDIHTSGLPPGAYTVWWVVFNVPSECTGPCGEDDLFDPDVEVSVFWATGGVVRDNGVGNFSDRHGVDDPRGTPGEQSLLNGGGIDPDVAEIHNVIKYHGPASSDAATLAAQTTTAGGSCDSGANAVDLGPPFGVQCFDPQAAVHLP